MLEKMDDFFNDRIEEYDDHQLNAIASAKEFYPFTARSLPAEEGVKVLDLGCGTGLELEYYFRLNPAAEVTCIDMAGRMLDKLTKKFGDKDIRIIKGSYFDVELKESYYDAVLSVESLHHYDMEKKVIFYGKIRRALKQNGYFILTDYFAATDEEEKFLASELARLKSEQGIKDCEFYHYDTPLTAEHEIEALKTAGFTGAEVIKRWESTCCIKAVRKMSGKAEKRDRGV